MAVEFGFLSDRVEKLNRRVLATRQLLMQTPAESHLFETHCAVLRDQELRLARMRRSLTEIAARDHRPGRRQRAST